VRSISRQPTFEDYEDFSQKRAAQSKGRHLEGNQLPLIQRRATIEDRAQIAENDVRCNSIHERTLGFIMARNLEMKLINTHYTFDRRMLLFSFSADGRVDFRELLRDASTAFHARIELRQIGVRDEASAIGGLGTCGRPLCCATFLCNVGSVNVKMAKQQGLSLNPQSISGCCGRLKCCLQFEADSYKDASTRHPEHRHSNAEDNDEREGQKGLHNVKKEPSALPAAAPDRRSDNRGILPLQAPAANGGAGVIRRLEAGDVASDDDGGDRHRRPHHRNNGGGNRRHRGDGNAANGSQRDFPKGE